MKTPARLTPALPRLRSPLPRPPAQRPRRFGTAASCLLLVLCACRSGDATPAPAGAPGAAPAANRPGATAQRQAPLASPPWHIPVGPKLPILPGQGLGPIRFGANLETIERLLGEPCEEKTEQGGLVTCRFSAHAVEFVLDAAGVQQIRIHRLGRLMRVEPKLEYGIFNGSFEAGVSLGMLPGGVVELLGKPRNIRKLDGQNPHHTVEVYEYPGAILEFDDTGSDKRALGGVILDRPSS